MNGSSSFLNKVFLNTKPNMKATNIPNMYKDATTIDALSGKNNPANITYTGSLALHDINGAKRAVSFLSFSLSKVLADIIAGTVHPNPVIIGRKDWATCASFEDFAFMHLGYQTAKELGPGEVAFLTPDGCTTLVEPGNEMSICTFLWVYYGYPTSTYEGVNVEEMRYRCGEYMAERDNVSPDLVAGVPDSGIAHAIGYANKAGIPFSRPFIKYTPTWPRSFMPQNQEKRDLIAKMKLIPVENLIKDKSMLLIDDSIVRGTQLRETTEFLFDSGAKEVHIRPACPPLIYGCKYLNFSRSKSDLDLITRRVIEEREGEVTEEILQDYADTESSNYSEMVDCICKKMKFTSLAFNRLDDMMKAVGIEPCKLCTYCWNGKEGNK